MFLAMALNAVSSHNGQTQRFIFFKTIKRYLFRFFLSAQNVVSREIYIPRLTTFTNNFK